MSKCLPVVVVAFNRARSLKRLLGSLNDAIYTVDDVPLIISIDKGDSNQDVLAVAESFVWEHGEKKVVYQETNLKLRKHVLQCGDYALKYGNVIVLEDDLYVSKYFYQYAESALKFTQDNNRIGGISLYNHRFNVESAEPFESIDDGYDNWYFQFASSWGEAWSKSQWERFKEWYKKSPNIDDCAQIPLYVRKWSQSSWLKYFIAYLIEKDLYFLYPHKSLTTNFGDAGTHVNKNNTNHQVPIQNGEITYKFSELEMSKAVYDAYYENVYLQTKIIDGQKVLVDLYGKKTIEPDKLHYVVSRQALPYKIVKKFGCNMRPHEENILREIEGDDFFLYDMNSRVDTKPRTDAIRKAQYNLRYIDKKQYSAVILLFIQKTLDGMQRRLRKVLK